MENSVHYVKDTYGYKCSNQINNYDADFVVFGCEPPLIFDVKKHGLKINKRECGDYDLFYELKCGALYLSRLEFEPKFLYKSVEIMGVKPIYPYPNKKRCSYIFDSLPVDYTGLWQIGSDFDKHFWPKEDHLHRVPFSPEVYKNNGFIRFENGRVVEMELKPSCDV